MYNSHRPMQQQQQQQQQPIPTKTTRLAEIMDALKQQVDAVSQEALHYKLQRDELEHKLSIQISELSVFHHSLYELERVHQAAKAAFDEEILILRKELETRGIPIPVFDSRVSRNVGNFPEGSHPPVLPINSQSQGSGLFGSIIGSNQINQATSQHVLPPQNNQGQFDPNKRSRIPQSEILPPKKSAKLDDHGYNPITSPHLQHQALIQPGGQMQGKAPGHQQFLVKQQVPGSMQHYSQPPQPYIPQQGQNLIPNNQPHIPNHMQPQLIGGNHINRIRPSVMPGNKMPNSPHPTNSPQSTIPKKEISLQKKDDWVVQMNPNYAGSRKSNPSLKLLHSLDHDSVVCCVKFSADGKFLATGSNHLAQIYDVDNGTKICSLNDQSVAKNDGDLYIRTVCFSPDCKLIATGAEDRLIRIWDVESQRVILRLKGHEQDIYSLDWSRDGKIIVSGSGDKTVKVWNAETGECLRTMANDKDLSIQSNSTKDSGVTSVAISPVHPRCIVAGSLDEMIRIWDLETGNLLERFVGHTNSVYSVSFSPDGKSVVSGSLDKSLKIWDISPSTLDHLKQAGQSEIPETVVNGSWRHSFTGHGDFVLSVAFPGKSWGNDEAEWVLSGSKDRSVTFWDASPNHITDSSKQMQFNLQGHKNSVISVSLSPSACVFATGSGDHRARIWRMVGLNEATA